MHLPGGPRRAWLGAGRRPPAALRTPHGRAKGGERKGGRREREGGGGRREEEREGARHVIRFSAPLSVHRRRSGHNHSSGHWGKPEPAAPGVEKPCGCRRPPRPAAAPLKFPPRPGEEAKEREEEKEVEKPEEGAPSTLVPNNNQQAQNSRKEKGHSLKKYINKAKPT